MRGVLGKTASLPSGATRPFVVPLRTVIGKIAIRFLLLFLRFRKTTSRTIKTVTTTPPKKLPNATPTGLIELLEPSLRPDEYKANDSVIDISDESALS